MKYSKELGQASQIALVLIAVTSFFNALIKLSGLVPLNHERIDIWNFIKYNILWFIIVILIILSLCICIKKVTGEFNLNFLNNQVIRFTAGFLILCEGILNMFFRMNTLLMNLYTLHQAEASFGQNMIVTSKYASITGIIPIVVYLIQALLGLYLVLHPAKNEDNEKQS